MIPMLAVSQKPERVLNILVSSTHRIRPNGIRAGTTRVGAGATVMVLMLLLLHGRSRR